VDRIPGVMVDIGEVATDHVDRPRDLQVRAHDEDLFAHE
jgi:hypothetical protein